VLEKFRVGGQGPSRTGHLFPRIHHNNIVKQPSGEGEGFKHWISRIIDHANTDSDVNSPHIRPSHPNNLPRSDPALHTANQDK